MWRLYYYSISRLFTSLNIFHVLVYTIYGNMQWKVLVDVNGFFQWNVLQIMFSWLIGCVKMLHLAFSIVFLPFSTLSSHWLCSPSNIIHIHQRFMSQHNPKWICRYFNQSVSLLALAFHFYSTFIATQITILTRSCCGGKHTKRACPEFQNSILSTWFGVGTNSGGH